MMWPSQVFLGIIALLPKSLVDERPVCKCPTLCRVYCKIRGVFLDEWSRGHREFWGDAVKGSSALQAALRREICHEVAMFEGQKSMA
eukprot:4583497-Pyramimonas_sp.AAC.1